MLSRELSNKREHSPLQHNGHSKKRRGILPKLSGCKGDSGRIVLSDLQHLLM